MSASSCVCLTDGLRMYMIIPQIKMDTPIAITPCHLRQIKRHDMSSRKGEWGHNEPQEAERERRERSEEGSRGDHFWLTMGLTMTSDTTDMSLRRISKDGPAV